MFKILSFLVLGLMVLAVALNAGTTPQKTASASVIANKGQQSSNVDFRQFRFATIQGDTTSLAAYQGKVVLIVNVASKCGNTPQYAALEQLYKDYKDRGLVIIGFPANNFGGQEPGTNAEILQFCSATYDVTFPMMAKISVKGSDIHPLFAALTEKSNLPGEIKWNFSKFLLDRQGRLVARFDPTVKPDSDEVVSAIKKLL